MNKTEILSNFFSEINKKIMMLERYFVRLINYNYISCKQTVKCCKDIIIFNLVKILQNNVRDLFI